MNGKISKDGTLKIFRGNKFENQCCPWVEKERPCGDWCPLFAEPQTVPVTPVDLEANKPLRPEWVTQLILCKRRIFFKTFTDERESGEVK